MINIVKKNERANNEEEEIAEPIPIQTRRTIVRKIQKIEITIINEDITIKMTTDLKQIPCSSQVNFLLLSRTYVDKTGIIQKLLEEESHTFIARPRKFGKKLVIDIIYHSK